MRSKINKIFHKKGRRCRKKQILAMFTLIEMLISMALIALLLSTLSFFFYQMTSLNSKAEKERKRSFQLRYAESRLSSTLPKALAPNNAQKDFVFFSGYGSDPLFKQGSPHLVFSYDGCVNLVDPLYSNHLLGDLFLDNSNNLTLAIAPSPKKWEKNSPPAVVQELLLEKVEALEFAFYNPKEEGDESEKKEKKLPKGAQLEKPETNGGWIPQWKQSYYKLPVLVKVTLTLAEEEGEKKKRVMLFPIANCDAEIVYR